MTSYLMLIPAGVILMTGSILCYSRFARVSLWFLIVMAVLGAVNSLLWALASRYAKTPNQLYIIGCIWDVITLFCYTILPAISGMIDLNRMQWLGVAVMIAGVAIIKLGE